MLEEETTFQVRTVEISDGRRLYLYTFDDLGQETGQDEGP